MSKTRDYGLALPGSSPAQETTYLMEAANGMLVRVPENRLEAWQQAQKSGAADRPLTEAERSLIDRIVQRIYHT